MLSYLKKLVANPVIRNIAIVTFISLGIKAVAFYKEVLIASTFGLSLILDTFLITILIPGFINSVFIGSLNNIFIPNYILEKKQNGNLASFQAVVFIVITATMIAFILLGYLTSDLFIEKVFPNKDFEYYRLIKLQLSFVLPSIIFMGFSTVLSGLLEMENKFFLGNIGSILFPLTTIFCLLFLRNELGDLVLALGFLIGTIFSFIYLLIQAIRNKVLFFAKPRLNLNSKTMLRQVPHKVMAGFFAGSNSFVDQYFAAQLAIGAIGAINYGSKIPSFTLSLIILSIGKVLLPHFSNLVATDLNKAFEHLFKTLKATFAIAFATSLFVYLFTPEIISLLFERNEFTTDDTFIVSKIQRIIVIYVPFALCGIVLTKFLTTLNKNKFMARMSFFSFLFNIVLDYYLIQKYDLYGIAIGTTIVFTFRSLVYFIYMLNVRKKLSVI